MQKENTRKRASQGKFLRHRAGRLVCLGPAEEVKPQKQARGGGDSGSRQRQAAASSGAPPSTPRKGKDLALSMTDNLFRRSWPDEPARTGPSRWNGSLVRP